MSCRSCVAQGHASGNDPDSLTSLAAASGHVIMRVCRRRENYFLGRKKKVKMKVKTISFGKGTAKFRQMSYKCSWDENIICLTSQNCSYVLI